MDRQRKIEELAAMLDGEVRNNEQLSEINSKLEEDNEFRQEFEAQREIKSLLAGLPEYEAPDFMQTRVMAEIKARKQPQGFAGWWRYAAAAGGGFAAAMALTFGGMFGPAGQRAMTLADNENTNNSADAESSYIQPGAFASTDQLFLDQNWETTTIPVSGEIDPRAESFLQFASEAHDYERMLQVSENMSPDMSEAVILLVNEGGQ